MKTNWFFCNKVKLATTQYACLQKIHNFGKAKRNGTSSRMVHKMNSQEHISHDSKLWNSSLDGRLSYVAKSAIRLAIDDLVYRLLPRMMSYNDGCAIRLALSDTQRTKGNERSDVKALQNHLQKWSPGCAVLSSHEPGAMLPDDIRTGALSA